MTFNSDSTVTMYAFNFESGGFVLVSASDNSDPILAYSNRGYFQSKDSIVNDGLLCFLDDCETVILGREKKSESGLRNETEFSESKAKWQDLSDNYVPSYGATSGIELWYSSDASLENEIETESGKAFVPTTYELTLFNNCGEIVTYKGVFEKDPLTSNQIMEDDVDISIFPNPSCGKFTVVANSEINSLVITNTNGTGVYEHTGKKSLRLDLDLSYFPSGVYSITINTSEKQIVKQIILK